MLRRRVGMEFASHWAWTICVESCGSEEGSRGIFPKRSQPTASGLSRIGAWNKLAPAFPKRSQSTAPECHDRNQGMTGREIAIIKGTGAKRRPGRAPGFDGTRELR